jgi:transposase-like protein
MKIHVKVKGKWMYLYRAVEKEKTIDFLLAKRRNKYVAHKLVPGKSNQ